MIRAFAALALATAAAASTAAIAASSTAADALKSSSPWWERVTVTIAGDGMARSCQFVSSLRPDDAQKCSVEGSQAAAAGSAGSKDEYTRITFERRFTPGKPEGGGLEAGDTFLGAQVMALAIDSAGSVKACQIVAASGEMKPDYGCDEARAEKFEASVGRQPDAARIGYMTILVYGHAEHMV